MSEQLDQPKQIAVTVTSVISSAGAIIAAVCAIVSTSQVLKAFQVDAREKYFSRKLDACDAFAETENEISANPMVAASNDAGRRRMILQANRLSMLFPDAVSRASLTFINEMDIIYAGAHGGPQSAAMSMDAGALVQSAINLELACQSDIKSTVKMPE